MKTHSKIEKGKMKESNAQKKQSSEIIDDIINDCGDMKEEEKDKNNIFKWRTLEDTVICNAYNNFKSGKKLLSFDLDDTIISFEKKKSRKSKSPDKKIIKKKKNLVLFLLI